MHLRKLGGWWLGAFCAVVLLAGMITTAEARSAGEVLDDTLITTEINARFAADPDVSAWDINVDTSHGVVNLAGVVENEKIRQRAIQLAEGVEGVKRVEVKDLRVER